MGRITESRIAHVIAGNIVATGGAIFVLNVAGIVGLGFAVDEVGEASGRETGLGFEFESNVSKSIEVPPPSATVRTYNAFITGLASANFTVNANFDRLGCDGSATARYASVGTIAARASSIKVVESDDHSRVDVTVSEQPSVESGFDLSKSKVGTNFGFGLCTLDNVVNLVGSMYPVAQAAADTVGDCVLAKPESQDAFKKSMNDFVRTAYPQAATINITMPPAIDATTSPNQRRLIEAQQQQSKGSTEVSSTSVQNCDFKNFRVESINLSESTGVTANG